MNSFYQTALSHRSIRKYRPTPISDALIEKILNAGTRASSSGNMQPYSIIVTRDRKIKDQLLPLHFNQSMVLEAPVLITFCADFHRMRLWLEENDAPENFDNLMSFLIGTIDATLASQNVALAAEAEGLGICYMGTTLASCKGISKVLKLPKHVVPVVGFSLGYPDENPHCRDRLPLKSVIHFETYQDYSSEEIQQAYEDKEKSGMQRYSSQPELKEKIEKHKIENLAQVYTKLKYTKESHIKYSQEILRCLKNQGFEID